MDDLPEWEDLEPGVKFRYKRRVMLVAGVLPGEVYCRVLWPHEGSRTIIPRSEYLDWRIKSLIRKMMARMANPLRSR